MGNFLSKSGYGRENSTKTDKKFSYEINCRKWIPETLKFRTFKIAVPVNESKTISGIATKSNLEINIKKCVANRFKSLFWYEGRKIYA